MSAFLDACRGVAGPRHVPVWFMRQAGRSLPEYRAIRGVGSILDAIKQPDLALRRGDLDDAAISAITGQARETARAKLARSEAQHVRAAFEAARV